MRAQLEKLLDISSNLRHVQVRVLPFSSGHLVGGGSFTILRFAGPESPDRVYAEHLTGAIVLDRKDEVEHYRMLLDRACIEAEPRERSRKLLESFVREM